MRKHKILVCPPTFYDISYSINPWMDVKDKVNKEQVARKYQELKDKFRELGAEVLEIKPDPNLPDMVYSANFGFIKDKTFIPSNFKNKERRGEATHAKKYFKKLGFKIKELPENVFFEGQADLILNHTAYFMAWGPRTSFEAKYEFEKFLEKPVIDLELVDPYFFHLDNSFLMLDYDTAVYNPKAFSKGALKRIDKHFKHHIRVSSEDSNKLACNAVVMGKNIVINKGISNKLKKTLNDLGYTLHEIDMTEYLKGGGSVKCASLVF